MKSNTSLTSQFKNIPLLPSQKLGMVSGFLGILFLVFSNFNESVSGLQLGFWLALLLLGVGVLLFAKGAYAHKIEGIKNHYVWFYSLTSRGFWAYIVALLITGFYVLLYFYPYYLGLRESGNHVGLVSFFDPLSHFLSGRPASQWFVYGTLYTLLILAFGIKFIWKYRHNRYQLIRTSSIVFFQTAFAFIIPEIMARLNGDLPYYDLKNIWPLNYYNFEQYRIDGFIQSGNVGIAMLIFGIISILLITPILTYFYGKRWYCSWVCGCGGLAETVGDPFRHLSDKSTKAWKIERWLIHLVLVFSTLMTTAVIASYLTDNPSKYWLSRSGFLWSIVGLLTLVFALVWVFKKNELKKDAKWASISFFVLIIGLIGLNYSKGDMLFFAKAETLRTTYGFLIGAVFSGVIGTGFYPILGSRVWCRFGCPMAAILGIQQRLFSRFRITVNGGQCISCGNCSTYCEMGIDVRAYAQKGANIVRASCVGCGICSAVCPRGVLKLENGSLDQRIDAKEILLGNDVDLMDLVNKK